MDVLTKFGLDFAKILTLEGGYANLGACLSNSLDQMSFYYDDLGI